MIASFLLGLAGGMRALSPVTTLWRGTRSGAVHPGSGGPGIAGNPLLSTGLAVIAIAELLKEKRERPSERTLSTGIRSRAVTGALAGLAIATPQQRMAGAALGAAGAIVSAYANLGLRKRNKRHSGPLASSLATNALMMGTTMLITRAAMKRRSAQSAVEVEAEMPVKALEYRPVSTARH